ncbi:PglL family O-oligosaccharyltransferase [Vibrio lamellibrachiae]|uniref:PglL family O-oligosaccharyltransferase n=1 Tax=Vibrio lamellibrachiae TaxID=2910253 RepID=UPI003D120F37
MAILHTGGTRLEPHVPKIPLNKPFLASLAVVFFIAMHFFMPNPGGSGLALAFNPATWLALSFTLSIGLYQLATNRALLYSKLTIGLFVCVCLMTLPLLYANATPSAALGRIIGLWLGFLLFVLLQQFRFSNKHKQRLLWFIVIAVFIEALFGFYQYLYLEPNNLFGYDAIRNRPYGIFQQPNVMASFLATGLVISGYLLARQTNKYSLVSETVFLCLTPLLTTSLLVIIASRTGWLGAIIALALVIPYIYKYVSTKRFISWVACCFLGIGLGFLAAHSQGTDNLIASKTKADHVRLYIYPQTLDMVIEKPFTGYGYGNFESEYILYTARQHQLNPGYKAGLPAMDHPHNELLFWGVEGGLIPILAIVLAAALVLARIYYAKKGTRLAMFALFVPIVLHSQLEYPFYHSAIHWIIFMILLFWVDQRVANYKQIGFSKVTKSLLRISCLVLPLMTTVYMVSALHTNYVLTQFERSSPKEPEILSRVTNPVVWKDRFDWDIYSTYLNIGLYKQEPELIQPYIDWSLGIIQSKPRPAFYSNLILAYQGLDDTSRAEQIRAEARYLFPEKDFSMIQYKPRSDKQSTSVSTSEASKKP